MKDTILNMLENEPLVKKAFLLLLEETPEDKQDDNERYYFKYVRK
uniref:Uncharacterized protein n=1 Tax=Siphoviridae sp. ctK0l2 TaxID=2826243 RepID=A0A8S5NKQ1_9CAUD|nr:MAG TPA: hypothetical protein [Siphoviridae sp. ctK0l2]